MASAAFQDFAAIVAPTTGLFVMDTELPDWGVRISTSVSRAGTVSAVGPLDSDVPWWISDQPRPDSAWAEHGALVRGFARVRDIPPTERRMAAIAIAERASTRTVSWRPEWHPPVPETRADPLPAEVRDRVFRPPVVPHR